jgi:hypothetical protein
VKRQPTRGDLLRSAASALDHGRYNTANRKLAQFHATQGPTIAETIERTRNDSDHNALLAIQELLDGVEWTPDTLDNIAEILTRAGYRVRDLNEVDRAAI